MQGSFAGRVANDRLDPKLLEAYSQTEHDAVAGDVGAL